jgi:hypothetical protein
MQRLFALIMFATAVTGCADEGDGGFVIRSNLAPTGECAFTPTANAPFLPRGQIHTASPVPYLLNPLIESRITALADQISQRTIQLRGARVQVEVANLTVDGARQDPPALDGASFMTLFAAPLAPNGGLTAASFDLIPSHILGQLDALGAGGAVVVAQLVATATVYGNLGGDEIRGEPFLYPVTACNNCVVNIVGACPLPTGTMVRRGNPCNPFQDGVVDCCTTANGVICPATVGTAAN